MRRYEIWITSLEGMNVEQVLLFVFVLLFLGFIYTNRNNHEGFDGNVPRANQTSAFPRDTASATTTNPQVALAQPKDVQALIEVVKNFKLLYAAQDPLTLNLDPQDLQKTKFLSLQSNDLINKLQAALVNSDAVSMSVSDTSQLRAAYDSGINTLRGKSEVLPTTDVDMTASNGLTLDMLIHLQQRIRAESLQLSNLRSSAPEMMARIADFDALAAHLGDIISSIQRGETNINDVNISPEDANSFLATLETGHNAAIPTVFKQAPSGGSTSSTSIGPTGLPPMEALQSMMDMARTMKWSLSIGLESDPAKKQSQEILDRIDAIEKGMDRYIISGVDIPPSVQRLYEDQLAVLKNLAGTSTPDKRAVVLGPKKPELRKPETTSGAYMPTQDDLNMAQGFNMGLAAGSGSAGIGSGDYGLTDANIQHRASAASFDDSMVGGLDYKTRALEMCRQIQAANLGDPANFGCIKNPDEVSASYSWKGNYQMVCSRLGDTWGNWYPQMFGCPKVDPTAKFLRQA